MYLCYRNVFVMITAGFYCSHIWYFLAIPTSSVVGKKADN